jgi:oligopeptide/dipeptide ABC transporter ATP-binding protein
MGSENERKTLMSVSNLRTYFFTRKGVVKAVDDISFDLRKGETLCIVGESGSGKTVTALSILRLVEQPGRTVGGKVMLKEKDLLQLSLCEMQNIRGNMISMVFQDPHSSLNPVFKVGDQISEAITAHIKISKYDADARSLELLNLVGIPMADERFHEYPHQFSGGMKQRVMIAMAIACDPEILIADEPTTALDLTIQAQILDLFLDLRNKFNMSIIYVTHDLGVVSEIAGKIVVMYAGRIMEKGYKNDILMNPLHPYTKGLIECLPSDEGNLTSIPGTIPGLVTPPQGCIFHPRCSNLMDRCRLNPPELKHIRNEHYVSCFLAGG